MKSAGELDIAVDPGLRADQRVDFSFLTRFRFEHLLHLCLEYRRSLPFLPTSPAPSTRRPDGNYDWRPCRCESPLQSGRDANHSFRQAFVWKAQGMSVETE